MSAKPLVDCPECGKPKLIKLIGMGSAVIIRGTDNPCRGRRGGKTNKESRHKPRKDRLGEGRFKSKKPFWRDGPIDKDVLKNPKLYVERGEVD